MEEKTVPRKRAWFQLHLSTCVVLMLAAGFLVGLNLDESYQRTEWGPIDATGVHETYGWPIRCYQLIEWYELGKVSNYEGRLLLLNIVLNLLLLGAVAFLTEWLIRWRRKSAASA